MSRELLLDTCLLEPPEPFEQAITALQQLRSGQVLHMIHRCEPRLLYPELAARELVVHTHQAALARFHIVVWQQKDGAAEAYASGLIDQLNAEKSCS